MYISREDIKLISDIMNDLPSAKSFRLEEDTSSGIGQILKLIVTTQMMNREVEVTFEISGVENW